MRRTRKHSPNSAHRLALQKGDRFGRLVVIKQLAPDRHQKTRWRCRCDCGRVVDANGSHLRSGHTTSCGCGKVEAFGDRNRTHGMSHLPEYMIWKLMKQRCYWRAHRYFKDYGGRGIRVCARWRKSFANFLADVGHRPTPRHSLDRYPDNDGDYKPTNVRWATPKQQAANKRAYPKRRRS